MLRTSLIVAVLVALSGCTYIPEIPSRDFLTLSAASAKSDPAQWKRVEEEVKAGRPVVITFAKGESLPLNVVATTPVASLKAERMELVFDREVFVMIKDGMLLASPDGLRWAEIQDRRSLGVLFDCRHGKLQLGFSASEADGAKGEVLFEMH